MIFPGRLPQLRAMTAKEVKATMVLGMELSEVSAKVRNGPAGDDEEDYALPIWAGVVPVQQVLGEPVNDPRLLPGVEVPAHIRAMVGRRIG